MESQLGTVYVYEEDEKIIATGKLLREHKFYDPVGHIEDIVVDKEHRGRGLGSKMIKVLVEKAFKNKCYKVVLGRNDSIGGFYEKLGFKAKGNQMVMYNAL